MYKLTLLFSDTEFGLGNTTDDFVEDELLAETIRNYFHYGQKLPIDFIFNGDTFDFLKAPYLGKYPRHITEEISLWKLKQIKKAHPLFFEVAGECLKTNHHSKLIFIHGNHDFDLEFPAVQKCLKELITSKKEEQKRIIFPGFEFTDGLLHIEHGSQLDEFFNVKPDKLVYTSRNEIIPEPILKTPWGYNVIYEHYLQTKAEFPLLERLSPRARTIELLPLRLKKKLLAGTVWYLLKVYLYKQWIHKKDPLYRFTFLDFKKHILKFFEGKYESNIDRRAKRKIKQSKCQVLSFGHTHRAKIWRYKGKWILNTGNWRDEYELNEPERKYVPKTKTIGFIIHSKTEIRKIKIHRKRSRQLSIPIDYIKKYSRKKILHLGQGKDKRHIYKE